MSSFENGSDEGPHATLIRSHQDAQIAKKRKQRYIQEESDQDMDAKRDRLVSTQQTSGYFGDGGWLAMMFLNGFIIVLSVGGTCASKYLHDKNYDKLTLLDAYDGGSFISIIFCVYLTCSLISLMGILILHVAQNRIRRGRMRYMIYAYIGWTVALCAILVGISTQCVAVFFAMPNLFKDGIFMSMILYGRIPEVAKKINDLQSDLRCCGSFSFTEWFSITWSDKVSKTSLNLPTSCCDILHYLKEDCVMQAPFQKPEVLTPWRDGCVRKLEDVYRFLMTISLAILIIDFVVELTLLLMTFMKISSIKNYETLVIEERMKLMMKRLEEHRAKKSGRNSFR